MQLKCTPQNLEALHYSRPTIYRLYWSGLTVPTSIFIKVEISRTTVVTVGWSIEGIPHPSGSIHRRRVESLGPVTAVVVVFLQSEFVWFRTEAAVDGATQLIAPNITDVPVDQLIGSGTSTTVWIAARLTGPVALSVVSVHTVSMTSKHTTHIAVLTDCQ